MTACIDYTRESRYTGGFAVTGNTGAIGIMLERSNRPVGNGNTSELVEE